MLRYAQPSKLKLIGLVDGCAARRLKDRLGVLRRNLRCGHLDVYSRVQLRWRCIIMAALNMSFVEMPYRKA
jgi:hypothetical protein